jgi:Fic family protein
LDFPHRAGRYIQQPSGYKAFVPAPLPPEPAIAYSGELQTLLSAADRDIGRLDALASLLPNPDLFVAMYVRHEAVLSSQIEGTQSTLEDVLAYEAEAVLDDTPKDVAEVVNYVRAMNHGLARLPALPLSLRLLREIHAELMTGVRGGDKSPGEFRTSQNWIGGSGSTLRDASFIPPPPHELMAALGQLELFLHQARGSVPLLVRCALAHAQFETIHPFLDGNGRVGRLLITLMLCEEGALTRPLLYLSLYLKARRAEYYDRLTAIRQQGHWEPWLAFFLRGVSLTARAATQTAQAIVALRDSHRSAVARNAKALALLDHLMQQPTLSIKRVVQLLGCTAPTAAKLVRELEARGWLRELTGYGRNRLWRYQPYVDLFHHETLEALVQAPAALQSVP